MGAYWCTQYFTGYLFEDKCGVDLLSVSSRVEITPRFLESVAAGLSSQGYIYTFPV